MRYEPAMFSPEIYRSFRFCLLAFLLLTAPLSSRSQDLQFDYITNEDGLSSNYVTCVFQDSKGFIWIGTKDGLNKYNGIDFIEFLNDPKNGHSISDNYITQILEDKQRNLWIGTANGLNLFKNDQQGFTRVDLKTSSGTSFPNTEITQLFKDDDGNLWIGTGDGALHWYDYNGHTFLTYPSNNTTKLNTILDDGKGRLILGYGEWVRRKGNGGIIYFDKKSKRYVNHPITSRTKKYSVSALLLDKKQQLWMGTYENGLFKYNEPEDALRQFEVNPKEPGKLNSQLVLDLFEARDGTIWVATDGHGINFFDQTTGLFSYCLSGRGNTGLNNLAVMNIYEDRYGAIWLGTVFGGVNKLDKNKNRFEHLSFDNGNDTGLSGPSVLALAESYSGGIWIGLDQGGVNYLNPDNNRFSYFLHDPKKPGSLSENVIFSLLEDSNKDLYVGTYLNGIEVLKAGQSQFRHYRGNENKIDATLIRCIYEDRKGQLWIGSRKQGLILYDRNTDGFTYFKYDPNNPQSICSNNVSVVFEDSRNNLWLGTYDGLSKFNQEELSFESWQHDPINGKSLSNNEIYTIAEDKKGNIWIGTKNGLNVFDQNKVEFHTYTKEDGLPDNSIRSILIAEDSTLWVATGRGISGFSPEEKQFKNYGKKEGIKGLEFNKNAALKTSGGKFMFGSVNGINAFYPEQIVTNEVVPPVVITNILINNKQAIINGENSPLTKHISDLKEINLTHKHNVLSFEFVALNFTSSENNEYAYMLEGFDQDWNYVVNKRSATYTNLDAGSYTFRVKGSNNDGLWNELGTFLKLTVLPPWWRTKWAILSYVVLFLAGVVALRQVSLYRHNLLNAIKMERLAKSKDQELNQAKLQFFTNISHEFKTPLTLILGSLETLLESEPANPRIKKQLLLMQKNATRLLRLINQLMDFRKTDLGKATLNANEYDAVTFLQDIVGNFRILAEEKNINLQINCQFDHLNVWFDAEKLDKVLYNLLSNAFKFTASGGSITVGISAPAPSTPIATGLNESLEFIEIYVGDTGTGIPEEKLTKIFDRFYQGDENSTGSGIGLSLSKSFVELHHGQIEVQSVPDEGTKFTVLLPMGKSHLSESEIKPLPDHQEQGPPYLSPLKEQPPDETMAPDLDSKDHKHSILIVEDSHDMRSFLTDSFKANYTVLSAENGKEGLELAIRSNPNLIVSDVAMPEMDGIEFCEKIKINHHTSHIPVVLLTARSSEENRIKGLETGADGYITKPFNLNILKAQVSNLIESRRKLIERFKNEFNIQPEEMLLNPADEEFIKQAVETVEKNLAEPDFNVEVLLKEMGVSRSYFFKKIKALVGQGPNEFVGNIRFKNAAKLLLTTDQNISEIAFRVGYSTTKNFRINFRKHFGQSPSEFRQSHQ